MITISKAKKFYRVAFAIFIISFCLTGIRGLKVPSWIISITSVGLMLLLISCFLMSYKKYFFKTSNIYIIGIILMIVLFLCTFKEMPITLLMCILCCFLPYYDIIEIFLYSMSIVFIIEAILGGQNYLLISKNTTGYLLLCFALAAIHFIHSKKTNVFIDWIILIIFFIFTGQVINSRTSALLILFFGLIYETNFFGKISHIKLYLITLLPLFLIAISLFFARNYGNINWISDINIFLSGRISIWSSDWNFYHITLFPQAIISKGFYFDPSVGYGWDIYAADGLYALGVFLYGLVSFSILIFSLMYLLNKVAKQNNTNNQFYICTILVMTLYYFSETQVMNGKASFLLPLAVSSLITLNTLKMDDK